ncbi:MAG: MarR family transcriptional regulator [Desulfobacter sp.]|nr:MAG: MarR family transcriptional regulator [Desulfobacter sp.]
MGHLRREMKKLGVGTGDYSFMAILFLKDGLSQDELSRQIRVDKSYTARAVARLEKMGLVERRPHPDAYRVKQVFLSQQARDMQAPFVQVLINWHQVLVKDIDPDDLKIIQTGLDKMMENAQADLSMEDPDPIF